jgi:hypothetical protein
LEKSVAPMPTIAALPDNIYEPPIVSVTFAMT